MNPGYRYVLDKDFDAAICTYTDAIEIDPQNPAAYIERGSAYADYDRAVQLDPAREGVVNERMRRDSVWKMSAEADPNPAPSLAS